MSKRSKAAHSCARRHGFWPEYDAEDMYKAIMHSIPTKLALIHSEVSEALASYRNDGMLHFGEELADIIIRTEDLAEAVGYSIDTEVEKKMKANEARPYKHGGKLI